MYNGIHNQAKGCNSVFVKNSQKINPCKIQMHRPEKIQWDDIHQLPDNIIQTLAQHCPTSFLAPMQSVFKNGDGKKVIEDLMRKANDMMGKGFSLSDSKKIYISFV